MLFLGTWNCPLPILTHLAVHLKGIESLLAAMRLCYSKAKGAKKQLDVIASNYNQ